MIIPAIPAFQTTVKFVQLTAGCRSRRWAPLALVLGAMLAAPAIPAAVKTEAFDSAASAAADGWVELGSRDNGQGFGFSDSAFAGGPAGEAGGLVKRDALRAEYVDAFEGAVLTLEDHIMARGRIIVPAPYGGNVGHLIGHSDSTQVGQSLVQANQMGLLVGGNGTRLNIHLGLANDVRRESVVVLPALSVTTVYDWEYEYDPTGGTTGNGAITARVVGEGITNTGVYALTAADRAAGAAFDCFGMTSRALSSSAATGTAYIDNVTYTVPEDYSYAGVPVVIEEPQSLLVAAGAHAQFSVRAIGGRLHYQWRANGSAIVGATASTLWISNVQLGPTVAYDVEISNQFGVAISAVAALTATLAPIITVQPESVVVPGGADAIFSVGVLGDNLSYQWLVNGTPVEGADASSLRVTEVQPNLPIAYTVMITNPYGSTNSASAILTVASTNMFDTGVMTNLWDLLPGERFYLTASGNTSRGLAYYPKSDSLLLASRSGGDVLISLDAATGAEQHFLDTSSVFGGTFTMNQVGVSEDGAIYLANLTANAATNAFTIYRWATNDPWLPASIAFTGDPGAGRFPGLRWGDNIAVRGGGTNTQILISPGSLGGAATNAVIVFRTTDGQDFQFGVPPAAIAITNAETGFANLGLAFGEDANTFFAKAKNTPLALVRFDLANGSGFIEESYALDAVPGSVTAIAVDGNRRLIAGLDVVSPTSVRLYRHVALSATPELVDQEGFSQDNLNTTAGGTGAVAFGPNGLFVLNNNNGIKAFRFNSNYAQPSPFGIKMVMTPGSAAVLSWVTEAERLYQAWGKNSLGDPGWGRIGFPVPGTGRPVSVTNHVPGQALRWYRVQAQ